MTYIKAIFSPISLFLMLSAVWGVFHNDLHLAVVCLLGVLSSSVVEHSLMRQKALETHLKRACGDLYEMEQELKDEQDSSA